MEEHLQRGRAAACGGGVQKRSKTGIHLRFRTRNLPPPALILSALRCNPRKAPVAMEAVTTARAPSLAEVVPAVDGDHMPLPSPALQSTTYPPALRPLDLLSRRPQKWRHLR